MDFDVHILRNNSTLDMEHYVSPMVADISLGELVDGMESIVPRMAGMQSWENCRMMFLSVVKDVVFL